jgi:predicted ATPase
VRQSGAKGRVLMPGSELIGRDTDLEKVLRITRAHPLVTLTGIDGIGKTMLALALARELRPYFADGVWLAEFSAVGDARLVPATIAAAVGLELGGGEVSAQRVAQALADRRLLLVLDTCEHVIAVIARVAEAMLGMSSAPHIIATSREALRAGAERVYPVQPLAVPAENVASVDDLLQYGAVRLFIERVGAAEPHFVPDPRSVTMIAAICRSPDGIPLAIELAAARAPVLGVHALAARIDDRFRLLTGGRRTALARRQALRATFDWSYELLAESERLRGPWSDSRQDDRHRLTRPRRARATGFRQKCYSIMCLAPTRHNRGDLSYQWGRIWTDRLPARAESPLAAS